ncbi:MAG: hypothetical protein PHT95_05745, partial [Candidatus Omnitrophica bacterium]|nr:hypothetical protein [Candidatus Omnitrophota bacterium]
DMHVAQACGIPIRESRNILYDLCNAGIISKVLDHQENEIGYNPSLPVNQINIQTIWDKADAVGRNSFPLPRNAEFTLLEKELEALRKDCLKSQHNKLVKDL